METMPIEKLSFTVPNDWTLNDQTNYLQKKLNELIDAYNTHEQYISEHLPRVFGRLTALENAPQPKEEEICQINPCPWCGSYDIKFIDFGFNNPSFRGECMNCQSHNAPSKTKQEAINAWNKRV